MTDDTPPFYRGHERFEEVISDERLSKPGRAIRVYNYGGPARNEKLYVIGTDKQLFDSDTRLRVKPEDVLNRKAAPDGWSVEGFALELLPQEEIDKIIS